MMIVSVPKVKDIVAVTFVVPLDCWDGGITALTFTKGTDIEALLPAAGFIDLVVSVYHTQRVCLTYTDVVFVELLTTKVTFPVVVT
jgi:hypothetical protein